MSYLEDKLPTNNRQERDLSRHDELLMLDSIRKRVSNYVYTLTGQFIPIEFKTKEVEGREIEGTSYTDGDKIVIGGSLKKDNLRPTVGLALHEGSHVVLTQFDVLHDLKDNPENVIKDSVYETAEDIGMSEDNMISVVKNLWNWIEDRRIDKFIFDTSPGYKNYYHAMYNKYFRSEEVTESLNSNAYTKETWDSYMFRVINFLNPNTDLDVLDNLREVWDIIDISNIERLESSQDSMDVACDVYNAIAVAAEDNEYHKQPSLKDLMESAGDELAEELSKAIENGDIDPEDLIAGEHCKGQPGDDGTAIDINDLSDEAKEKLLEAIKKQQDFLDNDVDKEEISQDKATDLESIDSDNTTYKQAGEGYGPFPEKVDVLVIRNVNKEMIIRDLVPIALNSPRYQDQVIKGIQLGSMLGRKLQVRDEKRVTKYRRKRTGKIDKRRLASLSYGDEKIFQYKHIDEYRDAGVHISVDASGSMGGQKWKDAMVMSVAIAKACDMIDSVDCTVSFRTTHDGKPVVVVGYDSQKDSISKMRALFPYFTAGGTTPEGLCFEAVADEMFKYQKSKDMYFVNMSDGQPYYHGRYSGKSFQYSGQQAANHTKRIVKKIRRAGIKVLSYLIQAGSGSNSQFDLMYGRDAKNVSPENITHIARTMNKKFLEK